jgi:RNA polymerase sigma-70 factor (ECF subfamily)
METAGAAIAERAEPNVRPAALDATSFRRVFDEHHTFVWRSLLHMGVGDAWVDDAVQEVFLVVHRRWHAYEPQLPMRAWLWGIARHVAHNQKRTEARESRRREALAAAPADPPDVSVERARELRAVREVLLAMDEPMRDVLVLSDVEGMTAPEIAAALEANVNTIYSRLRIARQRFADAMRARGGGGDGR